MHSLIIHELPSLRNLFAQECDLQEFPVLSGAPHLEVVQLHGNPFTWVPQSALAGLSRLRQLIFPECRVMYLPDLSHLVSLEIIHAHNNGLRTIPDIYDLMLMEMNLAGNPLVCDKALCWIRMWDYIKFPMDVESSHRGFCAEPTGLWGLLMDVHPLDMKCYEGKSECYSTPPSIYMEYWAFGLEYALPFKVNLILLSWTVWKMIFLLLVSIHQNQSSVFSNKSRRTLEKSADI